MVKPADDILAATDDQETLEPVAAQAVQLVLETLPVTRQTTAGQIIEAFSFDGELVFEADDRIIAG